MQCLCALIDPIHSRCKFKCQKNFNKKKRTKSMNSEVFAKRILEFTLIIKYVIHFGFLTNVYPFSVLFAFCSLNLLVYWLNPVVFMRTQYTLTESWLLEYIAKKTCHNKRKWPAFVHFLRVRILLCTLWTHIPLFRS